ncbi:MAG: cupin domain-containing protein [Proteobacteria bacterium]|nr:cupin domain-containing protein [Pseudomonadota bacterium]
MRINIDFQQRVMLQTRAQPWVDSPAKGVQRRMLDRDGAEQGRATSLVRFASDSYFPEHSHPGGEEYLVLEGTFSDDGGDCNTGTYVRNPVGSAHTPFTRDGCVIFVKLCQMDAADQKFVRIDTTQEAGWRPGPVGGLSVRSLHEFGGEKVALVRWQPGARYDLHEHVAGGEILVLDGTLADEHGTYPAGTWLRMPPGSQHAPFSESGCTIYIKTGHLGGAGGEVDR